MFDSEHLLPLSDIPPAQLKISPAISETFSSFYLASKMPTVARRQSDAHRV